jgi:hypothetical protein
MTRRTNARVAGSMFLLYIVIGVGTMIVSRGVPTGEGTAAKLAIMAQYAPVYRINMMLGLLTGFIALTLGVALYGLTRDEDHELALLALSCRIGEGLSIFFPVFATLGLLWLASDAATTPGGLALAEFLMNVKGWNVTLAATFFAVGSTIFCWLLLRGRVIPAALAWLGVFASIVLVIGLPLRLANLLAGPITYLIWIPMAAFEIPLGVWLIVKGAAGGSRPSVGP